MIFNQVCDRLRTLKKFISELLDIGCIHKINSFKPENISLWN